MLAEDDPAVVDEARIKVHPVHNKWIDGFDLQDRAVDL